MSYFTKGATVGQCPKRGQQCQPQLVGYSWTQTDANEWKRFLLRRCLKCHAKDAEQIHWLDADLPFCEVCFSQHLSMALGQAVLFCMHCNKPTPVLWIRERA